MMTDDQARKTGLLVVKIFVACFLLAMGLHAAVVLTRPDDPIPQPQRRLICTCDNY